MVSPSLVKSATLSASWNIFLQMSMRVLTFLMNGFILRYVASDVLGVINVRLVLFYTTLQFVSRESSRRAAISDAKAHTWQHVVNLIWINIPMSLIIGTVLSLIWCNMLSSPHRLLIDQYHHAILIIFASVIIELLSEPLYIHAQLNSLIKLRVISDGVQLTTRCVIMSLLVPSRPDSAIIIFAYAQLVSSIVYTLIYYAHILFQNKRHSKSPLLALKHFFPSWKTDQPFLNPSLTQLSLTFFKQTALKQLLTEGEKHVMTFFDVISFADQGIYDVINNIGSLPARLIFAPIEENAYLIFSQKIDRSRESSKQDQIQLVSARIILNNLLKLMTLVGLIVFTFGFNFSELALLIYGGKTLSNVLGTQLLRWHCFYVLLIAINGVSESFTFAAMSQRQIENFNRKMIFLSVTFLSSTLLFTNLFGTQGFIIANCLNMLVRIAISILYITTYFKPTGIVTPLYGLLPNPSVCIAFVTSFSLLYVSQHILCCTSLFQCISLILVGFILLVVIAILIYFKEKEFIYFFKSVYQNDQVKEHTL